MSDRDPVITPELHVGPDPVILGQWHAEPGDRVAAGEVLLELAVPGLSVSVNSPSNGVLAEICRHAGAVLQAGEILAWVEPDASEPDDDAGN